MNYQEFLAYKEKVMKENPGLLDLSNNNLYQYFSGYEIPAEAKGHINGKVYRCHLVEDYLEAFNLPADWKKRVGAGQGVRQSLGVLFKELSNWIIPQDVYPFYQDAATKAAKKYKEYQTLKEGNIFSDVADGTLLVTYPLKPKGKKYSEKEMKSLSEYTKRNPNNLIVIDMVYWLNFSYPKEILDLYLQGQVILLHSLSKMFLIPNCFGVTLFPDSDLGMKLKEAYKSLEKDEQKLAKAFNALREMKHVPSEIKSKILSLSLNLKVLNFPLEIDSNNPGYLFYSVESFDSFMKKGILVIPESVFGGTSNGSVISVLV